MNFTPAHIVTLCQIYAYPIDGGDNEAAVKDLATAGLVMKTNGARWTVTDKGTRWLNMLLTTPLPVQEWVDPRKVTP